MTPIVVKMTEAEYLELVDAYGGVCLACGELAWEDTEPDAEGYRCESCGATEVMGAESVLLADRIEIVEC